MVSVRCKLSHWRSIIPMILHIKPVAVPSDVFTSREKDESSWAAEVATVSCNWAIPSLSQTVTVV